ncbi:MAG: trimethylamine methyltransferase family protein [Pseudomonadota bacterium]
MGKRTRRGGGAATRRAERRATDVSVAKVINRVLPTIELLDEEALVRIEDAAETVLEEIGVAFVENPAALELWREAGADVIGERVHIPRGLARKLCASAPSGFTQRARNPERSVEIGGNKMVLAPVYGPPFVHGFDGVRRYGTIEDFRNFVRLGYMSPNLHHSGGTLCEATDLPANKRHLDMLLAHMTLSDKPFMGSVTEPERAKHSVEMCEILFGKDVVAAGPVMTSLININSPLTFDRTMMGALEVYAAANQATIISPFIVGGAMAPVSVAGTLTQIVAEVLAGVAYSQMIRPGAPVIFGAFVTSIDMNSGAPTFGTPEASQVLWGAGQFARRFGLPFRSGGGFCGSKIPDAQAGYESANTLNAALTGGVNFMLHACGWLEGGLVASFEKFVLDADQLGALQRLAEGVVVSDETLALDALREVGPGGHFLGCDHTQRHFLDAFWRSDVLDYRPYETWEADGAHDSRYFARNRAQVMLQNYQAPPLDEGIREALVDYTARLKSTMADAFV